MLFFILNIIIVTFSYSAPPCCWGLKAKSRNVIPWHSLTNSQMVYWISTVAPNIQNSGAVFGQVDLLWLVWGSSQCPHSDSLLFKLRINSMWIICNNVIWKGSRAIKYSPNIAHIIICEHNIILDMSNGCKGRIILLMGTIRQLGKLEMGLVIVFFTLSLLCAEYCAWFCEYFMPIKVFCMSCN